MLETLKIRNLAVIDRAEVQFREGLNIISGETGAGKSMVIQAISLLLGGRANSDLIRSECPEATVEGLFNIEDLPWMNERLESLGFESSGPELLVKRVVSRNGRHRIYVNGELATRTILENLCEGLVDLCSQHEHQSLLKPNIQLELVDRYGGLEVQAKQTSDAFLKVRDLKKEAEELENAREDRSKRMDFLKFQIDEIKMAELKVGEDDELQLEKKRLQSTELRVEHVEAVRQILESDGSGGGVLDQIRTALSKLRSLSQMDGERVEPFVKRLEESLYQIEEVDLDLNRYLEETDMKPERYNEVQERLSLIAELRRKYGASISEMLETLEKLETELSDIDRLEDRLGEIQEQLEDAEADLYKLGKNLSSKRKSTVGLLGESVTAELKDVKMGDASFAIELSSKEDLSAWTAKGGADSIQFMVQTNRGEPAKPLAKIASGGELSRIMLGIRRVISNRGGIGVYLFDEIDSGMGGQTAFSVGKKLKSVSRYNQVICITHLPQVASFADHHLTVQKANRKDRTVTEVLELTQQTRTEELARMLGGPKLTKTSLKNAKELLDTAQSQA